MKDIKQWWNKSALRELYWAIKTKHLVKGWTLLEYFCWRIVRTRIRKNQIKHRYYE